jgi:hypothetical protein
VASTNLRQPYLRAEEVVIGLIGVALLRLSAADRTRLDNLPAGLVVAADMLALAEARGPTGRFVGVRPD